jgi:hypothetical protein
VVPAVQHLFCNCEALSSNPSHTKVKKKRKRKEKKPQIYPSAESPEEHPYHSKKQLHMFVATSDFPLGQMMTWKAVLWMILTLYNPKLMCVFES